MKQTIRILIAALLLAAPALFAQTSTFITIPNAAEEALTWCGAATGQMIIGGYPTPCTVLQADVWASIQAHKSEAMWDTDPAGLGAAMMDHSVCVSSAHWTPSLSSTSAQSVMWSIAKWMKNLHYAAAVVLDTDGHNAIPSHKEHWVVVKGIVTDLDPTTTSTVTLQYVLIVDPSPATLGDPPLERWLTGSQWYAMFKPVTLAGSGYNGKYVAVIEPPPHPGIATARPRVITGTILPPDRAVAAARRALTADLSRAETFRNTANLQPGTPLLVNPKRGAYYIVPFGNDRSALAVLINAYNGEFMEAARVRPRPILAKNDAVTLAGRFLARRQLPNVDATLVAPEGFSPYFPAWRVAVDNEQLLIDTTGNIRKLPRP